MKRAAKILILTTILTAPLFTSGCVYYPARPYRPYYGAVWVQAHWSGPRTDVWVEGHWR